MTRHQEIIAHDILCQPYGIGIALRDRRWADVATAVEFAETEIHRDLAITDPALYRTLREAVTRFYLNGGAAINRQKLLQLASAQAISA
jgi:hypothetical protein